MFILLTVVFYGMAAAAVYFMYRQRQTAYFISKTVTSGLFVLAAVLAYIDTGNEIFFGILPGLLLCITGDVALAWAHEIDNRLRNPQFTIGVAVFLAAHIVFCWEMAKIIGFHFRPTLMIAAVMAAVTLHNVLSPFYDYGKNRVASVIYSFFIGLLCGMGLNVIWIMGTGLGPMLLGIGSCFFLISDYLLSVKYFRKEKPAWTGAAVLASYYTATYMFAMYILV